MMEVYTIPITGPRDSQDSQGRGKYLIYRPIAGLAFVGNRAMAALALRAAKDTWSVDHEPPALMNAIAYLREMGFLDPDPPLPPRQGSSYKSLVLLLTNSCHLRCTYCYAAAGEQPRQELSEEHARAAVDYLFDQAASAGLSEVVVSYHGGGEPTFAWDLLQSVTRCARAKPVKSIISLTTNGMWSASQREWIFANVDRIGISMDGSPETQDRQRPLASGKPSSPVVLGNMAEMDRRGIHYGVRMTAVAPWQNVAEDVRFICEKTGAEAI